MFAKLVALILTIGACGGGLLAMRQSRMQAAHELAAARLRWREHEERVLRLRAEIASRTTPPAIGRLLEHPRTGDLQPTIDAPATIEDPFEPVPEAPEWLPREWADEDRAGVAW